MRAIALGLMLTLIACSQPMSWTKPGATAAEFDRDAYECERDARMIPPGGYSPRVPMATTGFGQALSHGAEARNAREFQDRCMRARGYSLVRE